MTDLNYIDQFNWPKTKSPEDHREVAALGHSRRSARRRRRRALRHLAVGTAIGAALLYGLFKVLPLAERLGAAPGAVSLTLATMPSTDIPAHPSHHG